jgi:hypothetical protein
MKYLVLTAALLLPSAGMAQNAPATGGDIRNLHNDIVYLGNQIVAAVKAIPPPAASDAAGTNARLDALHTDLQAVLAQLKAGGIATAGGSTPTPTPTPPPTGTALTDPCANGQKWSALAIDSTVSIAKALACANPAFKLTLKAGLYNQVFDVPSGLDGWDIGGESAATVKISGQGGCTVAQNNAGGAGCNRLAWGKGVEHLSSAGTTHDLELADGGSNAEGAHDGQAGAYVDTTVTGTVTFRRVMFRHNENGAFSNAPNADIIVTDSDFVNNSTDGGSHSAYWSNAKSLTLNNVHDYGSNWGNDQKARAGLINVNGGFFRSIQGRWIEGADGAVITINGGQFVGNGCCQNVFGNGTESTAKGPGDTVWNDSEIWIGPRGHNFSNAGTFTAKGWKLHVQPGGAIFNDKGQPLNGIPAPVDAAGFPPDPPFVSGAK